MTSSATKLVPACTIAFDVNDEERKVLAVAFLSGDQHIITCSRDDSCLQVIEAKTGELVGDPWQDKERSQICAIGVSPIGDYVATGRKNGKVQVWKWNGPGRTATIVDESKEHSAAALCLRWSRHDDGAHIACGFDNGSVAVWSFTSSAGLKDHISTDDTCLQHIFAIDYLHDSTQLIVSGYDCKILILQINERTRVEKAVKISNNPHHVPCVACASAESTADGHTIVTGSTDNKIRIVELPEGSECVLDGHSDHVCAIVLSPDKRVLASVSYDGTLRFWDLNTKQPIGQSLPHSAKLSCVAFAADGTSVATGTFDGKVYVWDLFSKNVNVHDKDANARPPFNPDSQIPAIRRRPARHPPTVPSPIGIDSKKFFGTGAGHKVGDIPTGGVSTGRSGSFSWHDSVKVAASRVQQALRVPRTQLARQPIPQNFHSTQIGTSLDAAFNRTAEPINPIIVPRTRWAKIWLRVGCIPQYTPEMI